MRGQPEQNTRPHYRLPPSFLDMNARMNSQLNVALIRKLWGSLMCLSYFCHATNGFLYNQALPDVRSTGAGIKCLNCSCLSPLPGFEFGSGHVRKLPLPVGLGDGFRRELQFFHQLQMASHNLAAIWQKVTKNGKNVTFEGRKEGMGFCSFQQLRSYRNVTFAKSHIVKEYNKLEWPYKETKSFK